MLAWRVKSTGLSRQRKVHLLKGNRGRVGERHFLDQIHNDPVNLNFFFLRRSAKSFAGLPVESSFHFPQARLA